METKNYFERENKTELQYFCQLQVSNKFRKTMNATELELCNWILQQLVHRTATEEEVRKVAMRVQDYLDNINRRGDGQSPFLIMMYAPLRTNYSGYIRIERANRRHQSLLLPIIDSRGALNWEQIRWRGERQSGDSPENK